MPSPSELQPAFRAAMLDGDERDIAAEVVGDGLAVEARLAVYRHHVFASLTAALESTFPVVCRLVDRRFFGWLADGYVRRHPPAGPCLFEYGAGLADFIAAFPACAHLPWLPDVARLEWAMSRALHAPDATPLTRERLAAIPPSAVTGLVLRLEPSVTLLRSRWPVDAIWRANQPAADPDLVVDLNAGGVELEIRRHQDDVVFRRVSAGAFALRDALAAGRPLGDAVEAALTADGSLDVAAEIRTLLEESLLVVYPRRVTVLSPTRTLASQVTVMAPSTLACAGQPWG